ncbi:uncharacterized protein EDB91DRAFT_1055555 [Suillus paluster]|uniref:uncharacterized protein n=1 Tax=Suillus paluster TaxID=48578 RepID=UPI001B873A05|nr:uncharacterized protein EDB91DRAFT_1055555 [Suillus paluster]KAG1736651.1 hypothetical protein EDB91DRAFT_1055555 [Suillus paluster]
MSSYNPQTELWLERSRLDGMVLAGVSYGIYFLLTVQAWIALMQRPRYGGKIAGHRRVLLFYIFITFVLETISFAANARYTEMIWIDLRDTPGGPLTLIENEMAYSINVVALSTGHIQEWFMQALLLHRCFVIWNWARSVVIPMITLYIAMIVMSILVQIKASTGAVLYNINFLLAYLCMEVGLTVIYTILVANRLLAMRSQMRHVLAQYDSNTYATIVLMVIESAVLYSVFAIIFIVAFALHSNGVSTLCFLSIGQVQGIAQLFIIIRVARGRAVTREWSTQITAAPTTLVFSGTVSNATVGINDELIAMPQQDIVQLCFASTKAAEVDV